ncbi:MAG: S8 family serine peptidase [Thermoplasmatales archaeon]|nr:MAG: S8 family serine peptidase [Thermoplasmatales archaeon]
MNKKIKSILSLAICMFLIATAFNATGNIQKSDEISSYENTGEIINEQVITVPESSILLTLWDEQLDTGEIVPYYSISLDRGQSVVRTVQPSYELGLRYAHFDPLEGVPTVEPLLAANADTNLFIVQFVTQPLEEFKIAIESLGGFVRQYIAQYAYLVEMSDDVKLQVESFPYVRWIGDYHPAYRLEEYMIDNFENAEQMYPFQRYNIQVHTVEMKDKVANKLNDIDGKQIKANAGKLLVEATLTPQQLFEVIRWNEINFVDRWGEYEVDMDIGREIGGANYIETVGGYTGHDVRGESFDSGFNLNHVDFQQNPLIVHGPSCGSASHGTACAGILFGTGTGNPDARGLLPDGQGIVADYSIIGLEGQSRYDHSGELIESPYYAVFQTASVGSPRTTQYSSISADTDAAIFDFDVVHCQSQSNAGDQMSRPQAWAKNMVSGGAVYHYDTLDKSDDMWNYGASIGPASDGRIKPTFAFFYDKILTVGYPGNNDYTTGFGGTSGATPMTAGHVGLFFEMWDDGIFGNDVSPGGSVFENKAHFTTAKAMLINTADQYDFTGLNHDKTRMHQGWGMPNVGNLYDLREKIYVIDETDILEPFDVDQHIIAVETGEPALKVTMTYADLPGNPSVQTQHRINDLTLKVISPTGTIYYGNNGLLDGVWSTPDGDPDTKNTVECVYVENPEQGAWTVEVHADEIIQDSHIETTALDADYALVASPAMSGPYPPVIDGPDEGDVEKEYEFTIMTTDPSDEDVYYWIDWGDGTMEEWIGPYASGEIVTVSHTWTEKGTYFIKGKAKNTLNAEGAWSEPLNITIFAPELDAGLITGGLFKVSAKIINKGGAEATDIDWSITLEGGVILLGGETTGTTPSIPDGGEVIVDSSLILGFGSTKIRVTMEEPHGSSDTREQGATVLLFFIKVNPSGG